MRKIELPCGCVEMLHAAMITEIDRCAGGHAQWTVDLTQFGHVDPAITCNRVIKPWPKGEDSPSSEEIEQRPDKVNL